MAEQAELLSSMTEEEWLDLYNRLRLFTYKRYYLLRGQANIDLEDIILEAITDAYQGKRQCPPEVNLVVCLCSIIRSKVSHLLKQEKKNLSLESFYTDTSSPESRWEASPNKVHEALLNENLISREDPYNQLLHKEVADEMLNLVSHDETLTKILQLWLEEPDLKPKQIAEKTGLTMKQIYQILKRLQRHLVHLQGELKNG